MARMPFTKGFRGQAALVAVVAIVAALLTNPLPEGYRQGEPAPRTLVSEREVLVPDPALSASERAKARASVRPVYLLDDSVAADAMNSIRGLFRRGRQLIASGAAELPEAFVVDFSVAFGMGGDPDATLRLLERARAEGFSNELERQLTFLTLELLGQGITPESDRDPSFRGGPVGISKAGTGVTLTPYAAILTLPKAKGLVGPRAGLLSAGLPGDDRELLPDLAMAILRPNLALDRATLETMRREAESQVPQMSHLVLEGDTLAREGEIVTPLQAMKIQAVLGQGPKGLWLARTFGILLIFFVFLTVTQAVSSADRHGRSGREMALLTGILLMYVILAWASVGLGRGLSRGFGPLGHRAIFLAMPIPAAAMLATIFLGRRKAVYTAFLGSILAAAVAPLDTLEGFIYLCTGSLASIYHLRNISERGRFIPSAILCAAVNALTILGINLTAGPLRAGPLGHELAAAVCSGLLSGIVASGLVPIIELVLGFTTNLKLMELGNLNRPILRELMVTAPGTYHHSVIVGSMVEAAAEAIGANAHLARVGAYYHDIGKIRKPLYFIENQGSENRHDNLTPTMSVLLLVAHVKDGAEMARASKLPPEIVDIVEQHHGTSLMSFFHHKALENRGPNSPEINEMDFRYPGPKPSSKEAGLVMLADICEAATRSLTDPQPAKIHDLVKTLINRVFDDGQLEASDLALRDLTEVKRVFVSILVGIYHHRVAYPGINKDTAREQQHRSREVYGSFAQEQSKRVTH
jgi:putative nucleotidyltransferase with HDIG domain